MNQSAKRLDVQKNVLRIGFDSSTEERRFFGGCDQKKEVAPLAVKNEVASSATAKELVATEYFLLWNLDILCDSSCEVR